MFKIQMLVLLDTELRSSMTNLPALYKSVTISITHRIEKT